MTNDQRQEWETSGWEYCINDDQFTSFDPSQYPEADDLEELAESLIIEYTKKPTIGTFIFIVKIKNPKGEISSFEVFAEWLQICYTL